MDQDFLDIQYANKASVHGPGGSTCDNPGGNDTRWRGGDPSKLGKVGFMKPGHVLGPRGQLNPGSPVAK